MLNQQKLLGIQVRVRVWSYSVRRDANETCCVRQGDLLTLNTPRSRDCSTMDKTLGVVCAR